MSWFSQVTRGSESTDIQRLTPSGITSNTLSPPNPPRSSDIPAANSGSSSSYNFPSPPCASTSPLSLENLSCASPSAGQDPISYVTLQEQRCVVSWFQGWNAPQRERFLQDLLGKAVPGKVCTLLDSLSTLQVQDKLPNIFECQLRLWTQWFESWAEEERNHFLHMLEERDPMFVAHFYRNVAGTAGRD